MTKIVICDGCGEKDDWAMDQIAFFPDGALLRLRADSGGEDFVASLDLCCACKWKLLALFPAAIATLEKREVCCSLADPRPDRAKAPPPSEDSAS